MDVGTTSGMAGQLRADMRASLLTQLAAQPLDVLVVGGGISGAGVALDAASRGLRVGLVERDDFACGTSSRSSKMIHGGLRYLAHGDVGLVREALRERRLVQQNAGHLTRPLPMIAIAQSRRQRLKIGAGMWAYDLLGAWRAGHRHRRLSRRGVLERLPNLRRAHLRGGFAYMDAQADDARLVMAVLRTAVAHGAVVVNGAEAVELLVDGDTVCGARIRSDAGSGFADVQARVVVNATGVWTDELRHPLDDPVSRLTPSRGIHLTVRREQLGARSGAVFFEQSGNSNVFVEPWAHDLAFVGTSDTPHRGALADPVATEADIELVLSNINAFLEQPVGRGDVLSAWAGLRPLLHSPGEQSTEDASRRHVVHEQPGMITLLGGKLTIYRAMAEDAVDAAVRQLGRPVPPSATRTIAIEGSAGSRSEARAALVEQGLDELTVGHLLGRYGAQAAAIARLCGEQPELRERLHDERPYLCAEVVYAATHEMARNPEDVLARRTRLAIETADGGRRSAEQVRALLELTRI